MSDAAKVDAKRRVALPELGAGHKLVVKNSHLDAFYDLWGADYADYIERGLLRYNTHVMKEMLQRCVFDADGTHVPAGLDDFESITMSELAERLLDGFCLCMQGRSYQEHLVWLEEERRKAKALLEAGEGENDPSLLSPEDSSAPSAGQPTGQGSSRPSSATSRRSKRSSSSKSAPAPT